MGIHIIVISFDKKYLKVNDDLASDKIHDLSASYSVEVLRSYWYKYIHNQSPKTIGDGKNVFLKLWYAQSSYPQFKNTASYD